MTKVVGAFEAKTNFSRLLEQVAKGEVFQITRHGKPVAELRPITQARPIAKPGLFRGQIQLADDFDEPLDEMEDYIR